MADWPLAGNGQRFDTYLERTATSDGTPITVASANTKGAWIEVVAAAPYEANGLIVNVRQSVAGSPSHLIDIGIGAAGSEVVLVPDLLFSSRLGHPSAQWLPIKVAEGQRVAVRCQSTSTANIPQVTVTFIGGTHAGGPSYSRMLAYGVATADSGGTQVDPGATANTKGAYSEISAATTQPMKWLLAAFTAKANSALLDAAWLFDIAIGAAAAEVIVLPDILVGAQTASDMVTPQLMGPIPIDIASGTRLAVRAQSSITDATDRLLDVALYGIG